jgi:hypothetical protein
VRPLGMVGHGKSTFLNSLLGYPKPNAKKSWMCVQHFKAGVSPTGMKVEPRQVVKTNPELLPEGVYLLFGDSEGIGSSTGDSIDVCDGILSQMKTEDATLLLVVQFRRTDINFINVLRVLKRCSSIANDNCVLVFTHAKDPGNGLDSSDFDPTPWTNDLMKKADLQGVFAVEDQGNLTKNVVLVELEDDHYAANLVVIRNMLLQRKACRATWTYSEMKAAAEARLGDNEAVKAVKERELANTEYEKRWHERRIRDLSIAICSTSWIQVAGWVSTSGMAIAVINSTQKVRKWTDEIERLKREGGRLQGCH